MLCKHWQCPGRGKAELRVCNQPAPSSSGQQGKMESQGLSVAHHRCQEGRAAPAKGSRWDCTTPARTWNVSPPCPVLAEGRMFWRGPQGQPRAPPWRCWQHHPHAQSAGACGNRYHIAEPPGAVPSLSWRSHPQPSPAGSQRGPASPAAESQPARGSGEQELKGAGGSPSSAGRCSARLQGARSRVRGIRSYQEGCAGGRGTEPDVEQKGKVNGRKERTNKPKEVCGLLRLAVPGLGQQQPGPGELMAASPGSAG